MTRLQTAFDAIDQANAADPNQTAGQPDALLYGQRMTAEQQALYPDASEPLQIACRGQHIERPRAQAHRRAVVQQAALIQQQGKATKHQRLGHGGFREATRNLTAIRPV